MVILDFFTISSFCVIKKLFLSVVEDYAHYNGEDINQTYWALRKSAIICDTPERPLEITGPEVIPFLDKIFPRQISKLKIGRGMYVTALTMMEILLWMVFI